MVPIQDASIEDVCVILRNRCGEVLVLRSAHIANLPGLFKRRGCCHGEAAAAILSTPTHLPSRRRYLSFFRVYEAAWIISTSRLVQTQDALNEAVYVILRIQGSEAAVPCPPPPAFPQGGGISSILRITETAWIISGTRLVQTQGALSEDVVNYFELRATKCLG